MPCSWASLLTTSCSPKIIGEILEENEVNPDAKLAEDPANGLSAPLVVLASGSPTSNPSTSLTVLSCEGIAGIFVTESSRPDASDSGWQSCSTAPGAINYILSPATEGTHNLSVWAKNDSGIISRFAASVSVQYAAFSLSQSTLSISSSTVASGSSVVLTFTARTSLGTALSSIPGALDFSISGGESTGTFGSVTDHGNGVATALFTGIKAGTPSSIRVSVGGQELTSEFPQVTVVPSPNVASLVWNPAPPSTYTASDATPLSTFKVELRDLNDNLITSDNSTSIALTLQTGAGPLGGTLTQTASGGIATFNDITAAKAEAAVLKVTENQSGASRFLTHSLTVQPAAVASFSISGITDPVKTGTAATGTATAYDAYGNLAVNYVGTAQVSTTDPAATLPADLSFGALDLGVRTFQITLKTAGTHSVSVTDILSGATGSQSGIDALPSKLVFTSLPASRPSATCLSYSVTIRMRLITTSRPVTL